MKSRVLIPELMDDPSIDPNEHRRALRGLRRVNAICQTGQQLANEILKIAKERKRDSLSVLDLGCGSGDIATDVGRRLAGKVQCDITGWDISPTAIGYAHEFWSAQQEQPRYALPSSIQIKFRQVDVFEPTLEKFDIVYCCLFLHHFSELQAVQLLQRMKGLASISVLVDDLQRTRLGWGLAAVGVHLLSRSPVVHFDGPQSVRAAFSVKEAIALAAQAGMESSTVRKHWPERFLLRWDATPMNQNVEPPS